MRVVGFSGYSGSGKTTLVESLLRYFTAAGIRVSVLKHAHHRFEIDTPGKDTWRHREAGAYEVLAASDTLIALQRRLRPPQDVGLDTLLGMFDPAVDWVFVEGYKSAPLPKIEVWRASTGKPLGCIDDAHVVAVATDSPHALPAAVGCAVLDINSPAAVAGWLSDNRSRFEYRP
jgi:molybdopterin-guanine dinucleotide biosynthesis protein B